MRTTRTALLLMSAFWTVAASATWGHPAATAFDPSTALTANATAPTEFDQVEEDWELVVTTPDPIAVGPQITTCMVPNGQPSAPFAAFDMNYHEFPSFTAGGMQVQVWSDGNATSTASQGNAVLNTPNETVTWTQQMRLVGGQIIYDIDDGQSTTWHQFGQGSLLSVSFPSPVTSLVGYDPDISAARSGVTWESNHVKTLTLLRVRYYANGQLLWTDTNPRVVHPSDDDSFDEDDDD